MTTRADRWLQRHGAPWMTHAALVACTVLHYTLLAVGPLWLVCVPCVVIGHRLGILLHEYMHGLGFRRYRHNHLVVTIWDGVLLMGGMFEVLRGRHLSHHREVLGLSPRSEVPPACDRVDAARYVARFADGLRGRVPYVRPRRILAGAVLTALHGLGWVLVGRSDVLVGALVVLVLTVLVPVSLRGAIEHHGEPGSSYGANDYRTALPMFNVNRHIHHHEDATVPWYRLEWRAAEPLPARAYLTHWYRARITGELHELPPLSAAPRDRRQTPMNP